MANVYRYGSLLVKHWSFGYLSDVFKIMENGDNLSPEKIAKILNDDWYGDKNALDYSILNEDTIIIHENDTSSCI